jgi:hypothetical protein
VVELLMNRLIGSTNASTGAFLGMGVKIIERERME